MATTVIDRCKTESGGCVPGGQKALHVQKPGAVPTLVRVSAYTYTGELQVRV